MFPAEKAIASSFRDVSLFQSASSTGSTLTGWLAVTFVGADGAKSRAAIRAKQIVHLCTVP